MGMIKDAKIQIAVDAAAKAEKAGRSVLVYRQNVPWGKSGISGAIPDMGEVIEVIEQRGWHLEHLAYDPQQSSNGGCLLLFRRSRPEQSAAAPAPAASQPQWAPQPPPRPFPPQHAPASPYGAPQTPPQWQQPGR